VLGVVLAVAGVLVASDRLRSGRVFALIGGIGLILLPILEWGLGAGRARTGPGSGLWVLLFVGVVVVVAVGVLGSPVPPSDRGS
jgi:drug/metabolite transporter superfamily protein YnfA